MSEFLESSNPAAFLPGVKLEIPVPPGQEGSYASGADPNKLRARLLDLHSDLRSGTVSVLATGSTTARTLAERLGEVKNVKDFGAKGDGVTNDAPAIQAALDAAAVVRGEVFLPAASYRLGATLTIPAGVRVYGAGTGSTPLTTPSGGTILVYAGTGSAVKLQGHKARLEGVAIQGTSAALGAGVEVDGDAKSLESWGLLDVLVYNFTAGTGLYLNARNQGAIAYGEVYGLRVRHAKCGIHIYDANSISPHTGDFGFANTNHFFGGAISGGGFDYGIRVQGGNNNHFAGMSVEPPSSTVGHLVIERGALEADIRIEGSAQPTAVPLVDVQAGASQGYLKGLFGGGLVRNACPGRFDILMQSGKTVAPRRSTANLLRNAPLADIDTAARTIRDWTLTTTGAAAAWAKGAPEILDGHAVLQLDVPAGASVTLKQASPPTKYSNPTPTECSFGIWAKTSTAGRVYTTLNATSGTVTSTAHSGSGKWEPVGMAQAYNSASFADARFIVDNTSGGSTLTVYLSAPFFVWGYANPDTAAPLLTSGGRMYGTVQAGGSTIVLPSAGDSDEYTSASTELTLGANAGNTVHLAGTARTIGRLNNLAANRLDKYTTLRLVFDIASVGVTNGGFITLKSAFASTVGSWLLLESDGDGTWTELMRG